MWCENVSCGVEWSRVKSNLNPTNYINTTALAMWNVVGTPCTHARNQWHTISRTQAKYRSPEKKRWVLRADTTVYIYLCHKVGCGMVCCMMWNVRVAWRDGLQSVKGCRMVW